MSRPANCPQAIWQQEFNNFYPIETPSWWWLNPTNYNSLRLTHNAFKTIKNHYNFFKFSIPQHLKPKNFVQLERYFKEPYYVQTIKTIYIISERDALMLTLHANNLQQYLNNLSENS